MIIKKIKKTAQKELNSHYNWKRKKIISRNFTISIHIKLLKIFIVTTMPLGLGIV